MLTIRAKQGFDLDFFSQRMVPYFHQMIKTTKKLNGVIVECGVGSGFSLFNLIASEVYISESVGKDCRAI